MKFTSKGLITENTQRMIAQIEAIADKYSYGEILDALQSFYIKNDEQVYASMARKHAEEFRDFLDTEEDFLGNPINEGTCGYDVTGDIDVNNTMDKLPGGIKSMPADKRTIFIKRLMEKIKSNKS